MSKMHVAVRHHAYEFLYVITHHSTDAIKAIVHTVNMKFRKLKKNNAKNTNKTRQFKQEVLVQRRDREQKKFCGHKTSTSC